MAKITVVITGYNEEDKIKDCFESIKGLVDEIIFVDCSSLDNTLKIARRYTSKIFKRPNNPMLNTNKNYGFDKANGDWILSLDPDERITPELAKEIRKEVENKENDYMNGYWLPRKNIIFGKWIQSEMWWPDYQLRLFRKEKGRFPEIHVHEKIEVEGDTKKLINPIEHENYLTISQYLYKMDKIYTENEAEQIISSGKKLSWKDAIEFPVSDFLKTFFAQKGYRDGVHGLVLSILQAFYAEIVFAKVWERQGFSQEKSKNFLKDTFSEFKKVGYGFQYWFFTSSIKETRNPLKKIFYRYFRRKIKRHLKV